MAGNVQKFRRLKHDDPPKFKVLAEDLKPGRSGWKWVILPLFAAVGLGYFADDLLGAVPSTVVFFDPSCNIKGNVSIDTGERIYHVPGQKYYDETRIRPEYGEHWFCSEAEARKAGWRKSHI